MTHDDGYGEVQHVLWKCPIQTSDFFGKAFEKVSALHVADSHHGTKQVETGAVKEVT